MPTLNWLGKEKVVTYDLHAPFHVLNHKYNFGGSTENKIIHGDNLLALKSLLPLYEGKIKCIYIDPPYNTGNENWIYNDNVNSPQIQKWLGQVVGREGEDFSRHDKWLCMMYPRLKLLKRLLADDGAIFISIDDNEVANLKLICDEIFGAYNFLGCISRATGTTTGQDASKIGSSLDYCVAYSKSKNFKLKGVPLDEKDIKRFNETDDKGNYSVLQLRKTGSADRREDRPNMFYPIKSPDGSLVYPFGPNNYLSRWRVSKSSYEELHKNNMIVWKKFDEDEVIVDGFKKSNWKPYVKYYLKGRTKQISNLFLDVDGNKKASLMLKEIFGVKNIFDNPKPVNFIERILQIATEKNSIVLDCFAGSGTTAHAVLNLNQSDGGNRKFILIELESYAENITAERVRRVGGSFDFYEVGDEIFSDDELNENLPLEKIREYIWQTETRKPYEKIFGDCDEFLGVHKDTAYYFKFGALDYEFLATMKTRADAYIIFAETCAIDEEFLYKYKIEFRKIPRDLLKF